MTEATPRRRWPMRLSTLSLGVKLMLLSALATVLVVGATFLALRSRVQQNVRREFITELEAGQASLRRMQDNNLRLLLATSSLVSTSPTLRAALETWRGEAIVGLPPRSDLVETVQREVDRIFQDLDSDLLVVTDDSGTVMAAVGERAPQMGQNLLNIPAVRHALAADAVSADSSFGVLRSGVAEDGAPMQVGCVGILLAGYPIGVLMVGERIERMIPAARAQTVVTVGDVVLTSTVPAARPGARWAATALEATSDVQHVRLDGEDYVATSLRLGLAETGEPATLHLVRSLSASLRPITSELGRSFLLFGVLGVLFAGAGAGLASRTSLQPLERFVAFMRGGAAAGAFARFEQGPAPVEVATLTDTYNQLIDSLAGQHEQLAQRGRELASTNEALRAQIAERERAERALRESEEQLRQSQKLEALGTLAGGVAHDFNNLLSVIMGYAQLSMQEMPADAPTRADLNAIMEAGQRGSGLIRQLLAFSRKQVLEPQVVDANQVVNSLQSMLRRLIGEDIELQVRLRPQLGSILADRGQLEQVVMNLVVNARDAMPKGGRLTIETDQVQIYEGFAPGAESIRPGPAVQLSVADTGIGMDAATRQRIFEPFFTTKAPDRGTGLGLSTVYGIVRQSGGSITVLSEPGEGTTFRICFPIVTEEEVESRMEAGPSGDAAGTETVLVAEDDALMRSLVQRCLSDRGYHVLQAADGEEALEVAAGHAGPIHLLLTDVVMPRLSGRDLAERLQAYRPSLRVIFMSGHTDEAIERYGILTTAAPLIQKPLTPEALVHAVRDALDSPHLGNGG